MIFGKEDTEKMIMEKNGMLYNDYPRMMCTCLHANSQHLDCDSLCLEPQCLFIEFVHPGQLTTIPKKIMPKTEKIEVSNYIRVLSRI